VRDTTPDAERRYRALLLARPGGERLRMAASMFSTARALILAAERERAPGASPARLRARLLLRLYGGELPAEVVGRIAARMERDAPPPPTVGPPIARS
jgi:hypothetical protein